MNKRPHFFMIALASALLMTIGGVYLYKKNSPSHFNFTLNSPQGPVRLSDYKDEVVLIYFGFLTCPDACPTTLTKISNAIRKLSQAKQEKVRPLFIDLDPERDTLPKLKEYSAFFHPRIIPLVGEMDEVKKIARQYGATFQKVTLPSAMDYTIDHTTDMVVIAPGGKIDSVMPETISVDDLVKKLDQLLD